MSGENLSVAACLRGNEFTKRERTAGDVAIVLCTLHNLEEDTVSWTALVVLTGGVEEPRGPTECRRAPTGDG